MSLQTDNSSANHVPIVRVWHYLSQAGWFWYAVQIMAIGVSLLLLISFTVRFANSGDRLLSSLGLLFTIFLSGGLANIGDLNKVKDRLVDWLLGRFEQTESYPVHVRRQYLTGVYVALAALLCLLQLVTTIYTTGQVNRIYDERRKNVMTPLATERQQLERAAEFDPDFALSHYLLGVLHLNELHDTVTAKQFYREAILHAKNDPEQQEVSVLAHLTLAHLLIWDDEFHQAIPLLYAAQDAIAGNEQAWPRWQHGILTDLGWSLLEVGELGEANLLFEEAIRVFREDNAAVEASVQPILYPAPAYCLRAVYLEKRIESLDGEVTDTLLQETADMWTCCGYHSQERAPDDYRWQEQMQVALNATEFRSTTDEVALCGTK